MYFVAFICRERQVFWASFPDLPGCAVSANDPDEVIAEAEEALTIHIQNMIEEGRELPVPRSLAQIAEDSNFVSDADSLIVALIPYLRNAPAARLRITLDPILLARIDEAAKNAGERRSEYLAEAARQRLARDVDPDAKDPGGAPRFGPSVQELPRAQANVTSVLPSSTGETLESIREMLRHLDRPML
jgi:predicted RNase H-like HicB family nuclease